MVENIGEKARDGHLLTFFKPFVNGYVKLFKKCQVGKNGMFVSLTVS